MNMIFDLAPLTYFLFLALTFGLFLRISSRISHPTTSTMAEATAADGQMKNLKISETKKSKKDGAPKTAAKKPQQQKKKVRQLGS